jgi:hypothetical protein
MRRSVEPSGIRQTYTVLRYPSSLVITGPRRAPAPTCAAVCSHQGGRPGSTGRNTQRNLGAGSG